MSEKENQIGNPTAVEIIGNCSLVVHSSDKKRTFQCSFDSVIGPEASQAEVYEIVKGCTASVLDGFNSTIFAYGQTGSGKVDTHFPIIVLLTLSIQLSYYQ